MDYKVFLLGVCEMHLDKIRTFDSLQVDQMILIDHAKFDAEVPPRIFAAVYAGCI